MRALINAGLGRNAGFPVRHGCAPQRVRRAPAALMWDIHRFIKTEHLPKRRVVIYFEFPELRRMKQWWLVIDQQVVDVCLEDPGYDLDLTISCDLRTLTQIF